MKKTWRNYVKDFLMIIFSSSFFLLSPAITFIQNGNWLFGVLLIVSVAILWVPIYYIAEYWHKREIHATLIGNVVSVVVFVASPFFAWYLGYSLWPVVLILLYLVFGSIYRHFELKKQF
jgi:hypothetical protein